MEKMFPAYAGSSRWPLSKPKKLPSDAFFMSRAPLWRGFIYLRILLSFKNVGDVVVNTRWLRSSQVHRMPSDLMAAHLFIAFFTLAILDECVNDETVRVISTPSVI